MSAPADALVPKVAICGRVTSFVDPAPPADRIVTLGTQEPRRLILGSGVVQIGDEVCIWGISVGNVNPPVPDPAPMGIVDYRIAPTSTVGCADVVSAKAATFFMPGEVSTGGNANPAMLTLPLDAPVAAGCVRIAVDASGNPVAVVVPRGAASATPTPRPSAASLPNTDTTDGSGALAIVALAVGALAASTAIVIRRRRGIPS